MSDVEERTETSVDLGRRAAMHAESRMLIDGELVAATDGAEFDNVSPATGLVLGRTAAVRHRGLPAVSGDQDHRLPDAATERELMGKLDNKVAVVSGAARGQAARMR